MQRMTIFKHKVQHFLHSEQAAIMPLIGLSLLAIIGSVGIAVDTGRAQLAQSKLSSSLDAAGLAGGATVSTVNLTSEVTKYLNANFQNYMDATITDIDVSTNSDNSIIYLSATATMPTTFMRVLGNDSVEIAASAEITRETKGLELVLVLDNTGSMSGQPLLDLQTASYSLIDILFGDNETIEDLWVGVVPFSQAVNIGSSRSSWLDGTSFNWGITSWGGCVDARLSGLDVTDDPPAGNLFRAYYWPDDGNNDWRRDDGTYRSITSTRGPNKNCPAAITQMTSSKTTVETAIAAMQARGNTHVNLGAAWGWRMLSPRWRGLWGGQMDTNNLPLDYNAPLMNKAAIIMTDGENTMSNSTRTAYWYLSDGRLGTTTSQSVAVAALDSRLSQVCTAMKNNNIIIYTIAFNDPGTNVETLLRNCATQPEYYFDSPNGEELQQAFRMIGDSLSNLRVSK